MNPFQLAKLSALARRAIAFSAAGLVVGGASIGAYQNHNLNAASGKYLTTLFAHLNDDDKHDPKYAVGSLNVASGLEATLFAAEPMLVNPTNIDVDSKGRVWVCEAYNYRPAINGNPTHKEGDRIVILEDQNGDGKADVSKVFYQDPSIESPLGIWVQGNKVIVSDSPNVWVLTDEDGDDKADKKNSCLPESVVNNTTTVCIRLCLGPTGNGTSTSATKENSYSIKTANPLSTLLPDKPSTVSISNREWFSAAILMAKTLNYWARISAITTK